jgi:predicted TPR repeat methyltransferase
MSNSFSITELESRIAARSEILEDIHLCAAIDAQLTKLPQNTVGSSRIARLTTQVKVEDVIFDDYINPSSVQNCLSPFTPSPSERIQAFINDVQLKSSDVVLDIGCGDGRVCIAVAKSVG